MIHILKSNGQPIATRVTCATGFLSQLKGLMFKKEMTPSSAMLFVLKKPSSVGIHTLFMRFAIDVIVLDENKVIQEICTLKPWLGYLRASKVKYIVEMKAGCAARYGLKKGDVLHFKRVQSKGDR
jgi:hypothetical protein